MIIKLLITSDKNGRIHSFPVDYLLLNIKKEQSRQTIIYSRLFIHI